MESQAEPKRRGRPPKSLDNKFGPVGDGPKHIHPAFRDKGPSKPWTKEGVNPWRLDMMRLAQSRPGFRARFVAPGKVEQRLMQGWAIASKEHYGLSHELAVEGTEIGTKLKRREMVLMEIPEERALEREAYNENLLKQRDAAIQRNLQRELGGTSPVHGKVTEEIS